MGVCVERVRQLLQLTGCFSLAFANDPLHLSAHFIEHVTTLLRVIHGLARGVDHRGRLNCVAERACDISTLRFVIGSAPGIDFLESNVRISDHELGRVSADSHRVLLRCPWSPLLLAHALIKRDFLLVMLLILEVVLTMLALRSLLLRFNRDDRGLVAEIEVLVKWLVVT